MSHLVPAAGDLPRLARELIHGDQQVGLGAQGTGQVRVGLVVLAGQAAMVSRFTPGGVARRLAKRSRSRAGGLQAGRSLAQRR